MRRTKLSPTYWVRSVRWISGRHLRSGTTKHDPSKQVFFFARQYCKHSDFMVFMPALLPFRSGSHQFVSEKYETVIGKTTNRKQQYRDRSIDLCVRPTGECPPREERQNSIRRIFGSPGE